MYTVKRAAELTGVTPDTLRAWERRYGVVRPIRSGGGYRLYDDEALRRLGRMKALVDSGWPASQAARQALEADGGAPVPGAAESARPMGDVESLVRAGEHLDGVELSRALDEGFAGGSFEQVVDGWLLPSLHRLGEAWRTGRVGVAGEHFVSTGVHRRLAAFYDAAGQPAGSPTVAVGLPRRSRHELGVLAFAVALRRTGTGVVYLGADLPPTDWVDTVRTRGVVAAVLGVPTSEDVPAARETAEVLHRELPQLRIHVGGGQQTRLGPGVEPLGHRIADAARDLAAALAGDRQPPGPTAAAGARPAD